jgi:hypothetical protein
MTIQPPKKNLRKAVTLGCLALIVMPLALSWILARLAQPNAPLPSKGELSWNRDLGDYRESQGPPAVVSVSPALGSFVLPEVLSVEDAVEWNDGWILLDRRLGKIHFLSASSGLVRSLGRDGVGPGELKDPVALAVEDSLIWIVNQRGAVLDRFSITEGFQDRHRILGGGCLVGLTKGLGALPEHGLFLLRVCPATLPGPGTASVDRLQLEGSLSPFLSLPLGRSGSRRLHLLRHPALAAGGKSLFLGTWDTPCIAEFDRGGTLIGRRCLPEYARPATPEEERSGLEGRLKRITEMGFLPLEIPEYLPWFDRVFATSSGIAVRRVRGEHERDLVLLPPEGGSSVTDLLFPANTFVGDRSILAVRDLLQGTQIQVFPNPWH